LFVPTNRIRIDVKGGGICHIPASSIRHDGDVIAYLLIVRIASLRIKRIAHRDVRRPAHATIGAVGIKQLHINIVRSVARIQPHDIDAPIWGDRKCAEDMPLVRIDRIVIDP